MTTYVTLPFLIVAPVVLFLVFLTLPRWCARSLHRHRMWRLRDGVVDDVLSGQLPAAHPAVQTLVRQLDLGARNCTQFRMLDMYVYARTLAGNPEATGLLRKAQSKQEVAKGLTNEQAALVHEYQRQLVLLLSGTLLLGSWFGLGQVVRFFVPKAGRDVWAALTRRTARSTESIEAEFRSSLREATDMAVASTRLGHQTTEWAQTKRALFATNF